MKTKQETFDAVVSVMLEQGARSVTTSRDGKEMCRLRGDGGIKSPAGTLIPDELYSAEMEDWHDVNWRGMFRPDVEDVLKAEGHNLYLVWRLETIHMFTAVKDWPTALANLAAGFSLRFTR